MSCIGGGSRWLARLRPMTGYSRAAVALAACSAFAAAGVAESTFGQIPCRYQVAAILQAPLGQVSPSPTVPIAISPNGQYVVGYYQFDGIGSPKAWFYIMPDGPFAPMVLPQGTFTSWAMDVNDSGKAVGRFATTTQSGERGFIYDLHTGQYTLLASEHPEGICHPSGINASGVVCGTRSINDGGDVTFPKTAFIWNNGVFTDLGTINGESTSANGINQSGVVAGTMRVGDTTHPFKWSGGAVEDLGSWYEVMATGAAINDNGEVVGQDCLPYKRFPGLLHRGRVWSERGGTELLPLSGYPISSASSISQSGVVVGYSRTFSNGSARGCLWSGGAGVSVNSLVFPTQAFIVDYLIDLSLTHTLIGTTASGGIRAVILTPASMLGDTNSDCRVNVMDLLVVISKWGSDDSSADVNDDGTVNVTDLLMVISSWSP